MAFLFKSKKNQDRGLSSRDGSAGSQGSLQNARSATKDEKNSAQARATPTGSLNSLDNDASTGSPDQNHGRRGGSVDAPPQSSDLPLRNTQSPANANASLYPWSQRRLTYTTSHPSPFPRYGAAVNATASKEGDVYLMGGLINSSTVKGDLWMIEAGGSMSCYPLATTAEGPGPRVGHASLLVGNAFIVYGGDTKIEDDDILDETLYLLNTSTRHWSRALPAGPRPSGRYGHSLNILGSKIFIFGGQVEGYFMNDLAAFDLNQLQSPNNRWEILLKADPSPKVPAARTNHSIITYNDKMYLFGGTNGFQWFNDVWSYDPALNKWSQLDCIGYIPAPREGHAAAIVDDVMYIFGGRTEEGTDLGDLAAFRITSRRWYTFQNMGPSPSPRSGHSMTTVGKSIVVLGGEPSAASTTTNDLGILYVLDTSKIRYPSDAQGAASQRVTQARRPSDAANTRPTPSRDGSNGPPDQRRITGGPSNVGPSTNGQRMPPNGMDTGGPSSTGASSPPPPAGVPPGVPPGGPPVGPPGPYGTPLAAPPGAPPGAPPMGPPGAPPGAQSGGPPVASGISKLPRSVAVASPSGNPPQGPPPGKSTAEPSGVGRIRGASADRAAKTASPQLVTAQSPVSREKAQEVDTPAAALEASPTTNGRRTPTQLGRSASKQGSAAGEAIRSRARNAPSGGSVDSTTEGAFKTTINRPASPPPPTRQTSNPLARRSSGRNSQTVALLKELDSARNRNAWYASELELARKSGYVPNPSLSPALESKAVESFDDEDRPLIEALLAMRTELANVQSAVDKQAIIAAKQIAEAEKQRDVAIQEAVYAKAKLSAHSGGSTSSTPQLGETEDVDARSTEMSRKLASTLHSQKSLQAQLESLKSELEAEKRARQLADDTTLAAQKRMTDLDTYKQQTSTEVERLKSELHLVQREAREQSVTCAAAVASLELLKVEKQDISKKFDEAVNSSSSHEQTFDSLRSAIAASQDARTHLETKLEDERSQRDIIENKHNKLKMEHEARTAELVAVSQRLRDAEELAEKHAAEARTHREAVMAGLDRLTTRDVSKTSNMDAERVLVLQGQVTAANALVQKYQREADAAADKLRGAEERIAGLEQYQEQSSREGVAIRRQLQSALRETQTLQAAHSDIRNQLASQQLETNAMTVQHNALKDILAERGISPTAAAVRSRSLNSPRTGSPEQGRLRELESQLASATTAHEETKQLFASQAQQSEVAYREKLSQLESDYQSAVHYVKGTEKMLKQLKEQLQRYKTENGRLKTEIEELEDKALADAEKPADSSDWDKERITYQTRIASMEAEFQASSSQIEADLVNLKAELSQSQRHRDELAKSSEEFTKQLGSSRKELEQLQTENALLEQRAADAEQKVSLLLDQVEHSVDSYRRRSRQVPGSIAEATVGSGPGQSSGPNGHGLGHVRTESSELGSIYEGSGLNDRNSAALDNLASELETLRSHWETTNKNYRLSTNFDFEPATTSKKEDETPVGLGLSESLADWRKRLDTEHPSDKQG